MTHHPFLIKERRKHPHETNGGGRDDCDDGGSGQW